MANHLSIRNPMNRRGWQSGVILSVVVALLPFVAGCSEDDPVAVDRTAPFPPDGVFSITGDGVVTIFWNANRERDLDGYAVYRSTTELGPYDFLAELASTQTDYVDTNINNGETWYYAVTAFDRAGNESELSEELVFDTPRPAGTVVLRDYLGQSAASSASGYDISSVSGATQPYDDATTDIYFGQLPDNVNYILTAPGVDIQDFGVTGSLDELDWSPDVGWAPSTRAEAIPDHAYYLRIPFGLGSFNFAKVRVTSLTGIDADSRALTLEWAYQEVLDLPELTPWWKGGAGK